jgi:hypothetical protein
MDNISEDTVEVKPVAKKTTAKKTTAKKATAKKTTRAVKTAEVAPVEIKDSTVEESKLINDEGQEVISIETNKPSARSNTQVNDENVIGSRAADRALTNNQKAQTDSPVPSKKVSQSNKDEKSKDDVAVWSARNLRWTGVGYLNTGYNIVTKEAAEKWLGRQGVRKASPEEVATYYGK